jgi:hypothetical protein
MRAYPVVIGRGRSTAPAQTRPPNPYHCGFAAKTERIRSAACPAATPDWGAPDRTPTGVRRIESVPGGSLAAQMIENSRDHARLRGRADQRAARVHAANDTGESGWAAPGGGRKLRLRGACGHRGRVLATVQARASRPLCRKAPGRHRASRADGQGPTDSCAPRPRNRRSGASEASEATPSPEPCAARVPSADLIAAPAPPSGATEPRRAGFGFQLATARACRHFGTKEQDSDARTTRGRTGSAWMAVIRQVLNSPRRFRR